MGNYNLHDASARRCSRGRPTRPRNKRPVVMRRIACVLVLAVVVCCQPCVLRANEPAADAAVTKIADEYLKFRFDANPLEAVLLGKHEYDGRFMVPARPILANNLSRLKTFDHALSQIDAEKLSPAARSDWRLL